MISHLVTKGFDSIPFLVTQGLGDYGGETPEPTPEAQQPTGGFRHFPPDYGRVQTTEARRRERERLGIEPAQQRAIDRTAVKIAASVPRTGLLAAPAVIAAPAFDRLLSALRPTEGQVQALALAILERIAWMAEQDEDEQAVVRLLFELD